MIDEQEVIAGWCEAVHVLYCLHRGEREAELEGRRAPTFDSQGLHPASTVAGMVSAFQRLVPDLVNLEFSPVALRRAAREDAYEGFATDLVEKLKERAAAARKARETDEAPRSVGAGR